MLVGKTTNIHLERDARNPAKGIAMAENLLGDILRSPNQKRSSWAVLRVEALPGDGEKSSFPAEPRERRLVTRKVFLHGPLVRVGHVSQGVQTYFEALGRVPGGKTGLALQIHQGGEAPGLAPDDCHHQRSAQCAGPREGGWRPADTDRGTVGGRNALSGGSCQDLCDIDRGVDDVFHPALDVAARVRPALVLLPGQADEVFVVGLSRQEGSRSASAAVPGRPGLRI